MQTITIAVPPAGALLQLVLRPGTSSGQVVVVASDEVEIRCADPAPAKSADSKAPAAKQSRETAAPKGQAPDFDAVLKRLQKLKPTNRTRAINSIKAMFQFDAPIDDQRAGEILDALQKLGRLTIDAKGKLQFRKT